MRLLRPSALHPALVALVALGVVLGVAACGSTHVPFTGPGLVDPNATAETRALFRNLQELAPDHVLFGHQDDLAYGVTWKRERARSDVHDVTGAYPAVYGWDVGDLELGAHENLDGVRFDDMRRWIREGYESGGVITVSWHMDNLVSGGSSWDTTRAVYQLLPGGAKHEAFTTALNRFAAFAKSLKTGPFTFFGVGTTIPIVFRPFHEHTGSWFWWGGHNVTDEEYRQLWRFTVEYLRDVKGVHNLLYVYSTDVFDSEEAYLAHYPGDDYVDVLGFDDYQSIRSVETQDVLVQRLRTLVEMAEARGKLAAFTETGVEGVPNPTWWTDVLLEGIKKDPVARRIAWVLVWRNANQADNPGHHYAPYAGHPSAADFVAFYRDPFVLFGDELPDLYR